MRGLIGGVFASLLLLMAPTQGLAQGKPVIAIYQMDDLAHSGQAAVLSAMIETAIANTSKFRVIEREHLGKLVGEQARAKSGLVTTNTPGKIGGFEGADFLIYGTITTIQALNRADVGSNLVAGIMSGNNRATPNCNNTYATIGLDIKITDARSGEVKYVTRINETQRSATACGGGAGAIDTGSLMRAAADKVASGLVTTIYPIQIAAIQPDGVIVLNYGEGAVQEGAVMGIYSKGAVIRDPATGEVLANDEVQLGFLRIIGVTGRVSRAVPITMLSARPDIGAIVRPATPADLQALAHAPKRK
ncbi:CsgG/HfaB family protein [Phenylobacterium sp.]|uniref:CsgG/HfaB family protein n=1 Tax=Phenylobacterium sp. TaxID=1871053 RepID=UPI0025D59E69|nr:CsgG/HfaB family protein [Phenylobacterium sp.]